MVVETPPPAAPAGWYPGTDGRQRYWDGQAWLRLPPPDEADSGTNRAIRRHRLLASVRAGRW